MKKIITLFFCCALIIDSTLHAMLFIPSEEHNKHIIKLKTVQDVPKISLDQIGKYIAELSPEKKSLFTQQLSDSMIFNIALLPNELRQKIVSYMFQGNTSLATAYYKIPLLHACKFLHEQRKTTFNLSLSKEKQEKSAELLLTLPTYQKIIIHDVINPSFGTRLAHSGPVISEDTLAMINKETTKKLFRNKNIIMVQAFEEKFPLCAYTFNCLVLTFLLTVSCVPVIYAMPLLACGYGGYCPPLAPIFSLSSTATQGAALFWLIFISTTIRKRDKNKKIVLPT